MNTKHFKRMKTRGGVLFEKLKRKLKRKRFTYVKKSKLIFRMVNNLPVSKYR